MPWFLPAALAAVSAAAGGLAAPAHGAELLDSLYLGDPAGERAHGLTADNSEVRTGGLGQKCRVILPAAPPSAFRLPMDDDQPDFAWADGGIRTIAFRDGGRQCWMTLGWRGAGINNIARVHFTEPTMERIANIRIATQFTPSGQEIIRPAERSGPYEQPGLKLLTDGERLPLAAGPLGGMGDFYTARYGDYLIGMNCTADKTFSLAIPPSHARRALMDLVSGKSIAAAPALPIPPATTVVLRAIAPATIPNSEQRR